MKPTSAEGAKYDGGVKCVSKLSILHAAPSALLKLVYLGRCPRLLHLAPLALLYYPRFLLGTKCY